MNPGLPLELRSSLRNASFCTTTLVATVAHGVEEVEIREPRHRAEAHQPFLTGLFEKSEQPRFVVSEDRLHVPADAAVVGLLGESVTLRVIRVYGFHGPPPGRIWVASAPCLEGPRPHQPVGAPPIRWERIFGKTGKTRPCRERVSRSTILPRYLCPQVAPRPGMFTASPGQFNLTAVPGRVSTPSFCSKIAES